MLASKKKLVSLAALVAVLALAVVIVPGKGSGSSKTLGGNTAEAVFTDAGDLIIPAAAITEKAAFFPLEIDGTAL